MSNLQPPDKFDNLKIPTSWMLTTISTYEKGIVDEKTTAALANKALRRIKKYVPKQGEKEHYANILDLCLSLSTIDRAENNFKKFYLDSLKEELYKIFLLLEEDNNE
jgi:hypothetical protein